jgi:hypothetical protein
VSLAVPARHPLENPMSPFEYPLRAAVCHRGVGLRELREEDHRHDETMGWAPHTITMLVYETYGAPLLVGGVEHPIAPGVVYEVRADVRHGVAPSDGLCPVTGKPRTVLLVTGLPLRPLHSVRVRRRGAKHLLRISERQPST